MSGKYRSPARLEQIATYLIVRHLRKRGMTFYEANLIDETRRKRVVDKRELTNGVFPRLQNDRRHTKGHPLHYDGNEDRS